MNLLKNTSVIFNPNALFELASRGMPSFAETMTDAKLVRPPAPPFVPCFTLTQLSDRT